MRVKRAAGGVTTRLLLFTPTPQSIRLTAYCQLPSRGAFWVRYKLQPKSCPHEMGKVARSAERGMAQSCQAILLFPLSLAYGSTAPSKREPFWRYLSSYVKPPSLREVAMSVSELTEGVSLP